ncbi:coiled-coil domain-containing protein 39-like isoform X1 [Haliotis rufescens]|uniref:coiled-coil domain-containing protein 39-like isoform X1 n=1 Tax=Haliotis rufescens TaxID=6454 RepID=UPI001EB037C6|nr:coiled-coil domain-containing protein 39-like isoform X1 [Haliotis rufescens]
MSNRGTNSILSEIEWDEGLSMPVANASNKVLEDQVQSRQRVIVTHKEDLEEVDDRVNAMTEHLKNVRQELQHTQSLVNARKHETETESHLLKIAQREDGRLQQEINKLEKELEELKEKKNIYENNIFRQTQKLEEMKSQMNWDQQALEAWLEESARKDEDAMTLQKYTRQDESKIKELSLRMEKLTDEAAKKRHQLDHEMTETLTAQIELDKTAEDFRKAHSERQELIQQWEYTIEQMQRRDKEMDLLAAQLARVKLEVRKREESIKEKQQFLEYEIENNQDQEVKISSAERQSAKQRLDLQEAETQRVQFQDELDALKRTVDRTNTDLEVTRSQVKQLRKEVIEKADRLEDAKLLRETLVKKLKVATESTLTAEERAAMMGSLLNEEETRQEEIEQELKQLRDMQFRKAEEMYASKRDEKNTEAEIQGSYAAMRNLGSKVNKLDHDSLKQQEIIYNQDFSIQQLERRINRMSGERSNEEKIQLEARIAELTGELDNKNSTHVLLTSQLKRLQDDIRRVTRELGESGAEKSDLTSKIEELNLYNDSSERELRKIIHAKQDLMVDENLMKLEIKRLRDILNSKADCVLSMEKRKLQLETAMKERRQEINIHKDMLTAQFRVADDERQQISAELHERISKIDKLRKRYEILMVSMAPPEGEEERSQAYYVIKAAQDKEELQREGDELDAQIRKAEKEIRALENTLKLMNSRNETYRKSFNKITETSDEMEEKQQLEEQMRAVMDKYKYKRRQIRELQDDLQTMSNTLDNLTRDEDAYVDMIEDKKNKILQLTKDLEVQRTKLERVAKQNAKYAREVRSAKKSKGETPEERDFEVREMREFNKSIMKGVSDVVQVNTELNEAVNMYFSQANLPPPTLSGHRPGSSRSSLSSARSSLSSIKSIQSSRSRPSSIQIGADFEGPGSPSSARSGSSIGSVRSDRSRTSITGRK